MPKLSKVRMVLWLLLAVLLIWDVYSLTEATGEEVRTGIDFLGYWAAGRLFWEGTNPYDPEALFAIEKSVGFYQTSAMIAWSPPWIHVFLWPFVLFPFQISKATWFFFNLFVLMWINTTLWRCYGSRGPLWIPLIAVLFFIPGFIALNHGSASSLVFAGLVGFVRSAEKRSDFGAGCFAALLALKPHVLYLFWPFLILWIAKTRRWRVLLGLSTVMLLSIIITCFVNPDIYWVYLKGVLSDTGAKIWATPTISTVLRILFPKHQILLLYLPAICGLLYGLIAWCRKRNVIDLRGMAISLTVLSTLTVPYLWPGDLVVLMPVALLILVRFTQGRAGQGYLLLILILIQVIIFIQMYSAKSMFVLFWVTPAITLIWILSERAAGNNKREAVIQST